MDIDDILAEVSGPAVPQETLDLQELTRCWVAERVAPEILPWQEGLMERVLGRLSRQIELVEEQTGNMDPKTNFRLIVIQTELERIRFLIRSFLRARIAKISRYPLHHLSPAILPLLSPSEQQFLHAHHSLLSTHYQSSFLSQFPAPLQRLDDTAGGISMVDAPDVDKAVFVRVRADDIGEVSVDGTDAAFEMRRGDVFVVRWSAVRAFVGEGRVELI